MDYMKNRHKSDLMIFAIDADLDLNSIDMIRRSYEVKTLPSLIIDGELHEGFVGKDRMEEIINSSSRSA
ncbi:MAG: hypothetical protein JSV92_02255 [archaeon]|nr:MAG: hypothetical protein JSV92_02255 [archaeon]